ncbi:MAG: MMPL family transporter [Bacteroidales bacterium]|nr:MMPL family transporter [Bacteroidales bacterium]
MNPSSDKLNILVRLRYPLLALMLALALAGALMIPRVNVNLDMTKYLPTDSPMRAGMEQMERSFPSLNTQMRLLNVMFLQAPEDIDATGDELSALAGGLRVSAVQQKAPYVLYSLMLEAGSDADALSAAVSGHYGDRVIVETNDAGRVPDNLSSILGVAVVMLLVILAIMCASLMEVVLFLITIGIAVALNMGTNALLPSVSETSNMLGAVLQMILSMDYSIILMNRYRQEKALGQDNLSAMSGAVRRATPAILSSGMTTIVSLLMLIFIKFKIGADIGIVLSKGVLCSLICNFTVLPSLALLFDRAVVATEKRVPQLPAERLSRFEMRWRIPLAVLFLAVFVGSVLLQRRTVICFNAAWPTEITEVFPPQNTIMLVYPTEEESAVPALLERLSDDPYVQSALSYPSIWLEPRTAGEMARLAADYVPQLNEDLLQIVYYAYTHRERKERLSLAQIEQTASELAALGLAPEGLDTSALMDRMMASGLGAADPDPAPAPVRPALPQEAPRPDSLAVSADSALAVPAADSLSVAAADSLSAPLPTPSPEPEETAPGYTYEQAATPLTAAQMAAFFGIERSQANTVFRLAGRTRRSGKETMSPYEFAQFVRKNILSDRRYAAFIPKSYVSLIEEHGRLLDAALLAGPAPVPAVAETVPQAALQRDSLRTAPADSTLLAALPVTQDPPAPVVAEEPEPETPPTPLERLAEMALSGRKYGSAQVARVLSAAGLPVTRDQVDLLYLYAGSRSGSDPDTRLSLSQLVPYVIDTLLAGPALAPYLDEAVKEQVAEARSQIDGALGSLRAEDYSLAAIISGYRTESDSTFAFVSRLQALSDAVLTGPHYLVGESVMVKETHDGFAKELLLLTLLTVLSIFLIVALTFRSVLIPIPLIMTVLAGNYINVFVSGLGGTEMYYLSFLIVQSVLMGAIIDYSILLTSYYRSARTTQDVAASIRAAYRGAGHSIMTSGLIIVMVPYALSLWLDDFLIPMILRSLYLGALSAILIILLMLPGVLAVLDRWMVPHSARKNKEE